MLFYVGAVAAGLIGLFVLDRAVGLGVRWLEPILPNDLAGQNGWLVDTRNGAGVFDHRKA